jgi:pyridoxal phosphate enzyme (YggS family)
MITENLIQVRERIRRAAQRANRNPQNIRLVCVTKTASPAQIKDAIGLGVSDIGENRVGDALLKQKELGELAKKLKWHMIGHLQTNKVKDALGIFDVIHSLDSIRLAEAIDKGAASSNKRIDCLIEVNTSGELSKYGIKPAELIPFATEAAAFKHLHIIGLMTMAPIVNTPELARPYFAMLRRLKEELASKSIENIDIRELSMGMTQDFEAAVEEGATMVRIGTAVFG